MYGPDISPIEIWSVLNYCLDSEQLLYDVPHLNRLNGTS